MSLMTNNLIVGFLCQFREFRGAGLSPEAFLSIGDWIGSEEIRWLRFLCPDSRMFGLGFEYLLFFRFVRYHMKRTAGTLVLHSLLPIGEKKIKKSYCVIYLLCSLLLGVRLPFCSYGLFTPKHGIILGGKNQIC